MNEKFIREYAYIWNNLHALKLFTRTVVKGIGKISTHQST